MKKIAFLIICPLFFWLNIAHSQPQLNSAEILLGMKKLSTVGSVLYIAAHPDDENTRLLSYLAKEKNLRTGYLSITRGDGGQNLIGKEQSEALGLIRTQELLAARRVDGAEQFFTHANDFGYSKNPEETFGFWNKDSILADVVWVIRNFKPDVLICRFPTTGEGGHGHHTASAILALEAFDAAADAKRFPEQLKYTQVWQAKRIFWNTFNFGGTNTTAADQLQVDVGVFNPLTGKSYGEVAAESRSNHKSQGFGSAKSRGSSIEYFKLLKGDSSKLSLFDGIVQDWSRFKETSKLKALVENCISNFNALNPSKSISELISIYKGLQQLENKNEQISYWKKLKLKETENLILACSGLWCEAFAGEYSAIPGSQVDLTAQVVNRSSIPVKLTQIRYFNQNDTLLTVSPKQNELLSYKHKETLAPTVLFSSPYWLNEAHGIGRYVVNSQNLIGKAENEAAALVSFYFEWNDFALKVDRPLVYKSTDPVKGEVYRPFEVLPPATINLSEKVYVFGDLSPKIIQLRIKANATNVSGTIEFKVPEGWVLTLDQKEFTLKNKGEEITFNASLTPSKENKEGKLELALLINNLRYTKSIRRIDYDHIPSQFILTNAEAKLVNINLQKTGTKIGYIPGAGDEVADCLKQIGYEITTLTDELLLSENLAQFTAIVSGVRAYNTNDKLQNLYPRLMEYINQGGNLIVQYNTNNRIGPLLAKIGPYPFTISRDRVTDETAEVRFNLPQHSCLNFPNKITAADFENWIQERGIYFASELDKNYSSILSMNDPNEKALDGSLIVGAYGKGNFVYSGLDFFRELPAGIPGAYRLLVNLISLPQQAVKK